ncbi:hypothetical protein FRC03_005698 [Tulasnella sp. 419]|nr:hypothetical protein FRC03_005698 [Tulasnella sp. 419]
MVLVGSEGRSGDPALRLVHELSRRTWLGSRDWRRSAIAWYLAGRGDNLLTCRSIFLFSLFFLSSPLATPFTYNNSTPLILLPNPLQILNRLLDRVPRHYDLDWEDDE